MESTIARSALAGNSTLSLLDSKGYRTTEPSHRTSARTLGTVSFDSSEASLLSNPCELRYGRRYLRSDVPYPLPCDLPELHRQSLRTLLAMEVLGGPICNHKLRQSPPKKILELGCGTGYWSAMCHDWFAARGHSDIQFVGLDIAPLAPNLQRQGMSWKFVQHDMRRTPLPFADDEFDLLMVKDMGICMPLDPRSEKILSDLVRIIKPGGHLETWESDYIIRSLITTSPPPKVSKPEHQKDAERTATIAVPIGHPFAPSQNKHIRQANKWIEETFNKAKLAATPSTRIAEMLMTEPGLHNLHYRRVAIPFTVLNWKKEAYPRRGQDSPLSFYTAEDEVECPSKTLTTDQLAIRQTALTTVLGFIEALEPALKETSGMNAGEWELWWASMMADLLDPAKESLDGECLEMGAWWAQKLGDAAESDAEETEDES